MNEAASACCRPGVQKIRKLLESNGLNTGLSIHKLKLGDDSTVLKPEGTKRKSTQKGAPRCPAVGAKKTGDAYQRRPGELVPKKFEKFSWPSWCLIEVTFSGSRTILPVGATTGRGRDHRSIQGRSRQFILNPTAQCAWVNGRLKKIGLGLGLQAFLVSGRRKS